MLGRSLILGLFLLSSAFVYYNPWLYNDNYSGNAYAKTLVERASSDGSAYVGDPGNSRTRVCFAPPSIMTRLPELFPEHNVAYQEDDDSNKWYLARFHEGAGGVIILSVDHSVLEWNDFNSATFVARDKAALERTTDPNARTVCTSRIFVEYLPGEPIPFFRPDYTTA